MIKKYLVIAVLFFASTVIFGEENGEIQLNPTEDVNSLTGYYIPVDIEDCFMELNKMLPEETIDKMSEGKESEMINYHHGLGTWIRNNWGLWSDSRLADYFNSLGILHPDDMSSIILDSFWKRLNGKPLELEKQVQFYIDYWENQMEQTDEE
ncbi:hypothetical protein JXL83_06995 [candidate division WOR-3 bacterium]|nr:hypothetical protein [candidate division WOR-3 bacterium]